MIEKRKNWKEEQKTLDINKLYFLDESSVNLGMTRLYGWGKKNERVEDYVPDVRFERTSIISTLSLGGINAPMTFKGTLDADLFREYVKQVLAPSLQGGDILVMDNLSSHKVEGVIQPLIDRGVKVLWLPQYSPDLNPIELAWSKIKIILRKKKPRTYEDLEKALREALAEITNDNAKNWFKHDGYFFEPLPVNI